MIPVANHVLTHSFDLSLWSISSPNFLKFSYSVVRLLRHMCPYPRMFLGVSLLENEVDCGGDHAPVKLRFN